MMKTFMLLILAATTLAITVSCEKQNPYEDLSSEQLAKKAGEKYEAILHLASPTGCTDPDEWLIADIQTVCGLYHIPYHKTVDKKKLQSLIDDHNLLVKVYRPMVAPIINCMAYRKPIRVNCVDGKATIEFEP